jgi:hypothetical protein
VVVTDRFNGTTELIMEPFLAVLLMGGAGEATQIADWPGLQNDPCPGPRICAQTNRARNAGRIRRKCYAV